MSYLCSFLGVHAVSPINCPPKKITTWRHGLTRLLHGFGRPADGFTWPVLKSCDPKIPSLTPTKPFCSIYNISNIFLAVLYTHAIPCHSTSISIPSCMAIAAATFCRANACHEMPQSQSAKAKGDNCQKRGTGLPRPVSNFLGHHQLLTDTLSWYSEVH